MMLTMILAFFKQENAFAKLLDTLYGILFHPKATMNLIAEQEKPPLILAAMWVAVVSFLAPFIQVALVESDTQLLFLTAPLAVITGIVSWVFINMLIASLAYAFNRHFHIKTLLTLSGLATIPWVLMGPALLLKTGLGDPGKLLFVLAGTAIWVWTVLLFGLAIAKVYQANFIRVSIILTMPFGMSLVLLAWLIGFIGNAQQLLSS